MAQISATYGDPQGFEVVVSAETPPPGAAREQRQEKTQERHWIPNSTDGAIVTPGGLALSLAV